MINLENITGALECTGYHKSSSFSSEPVINVVASDLMSEVLVADEENLLLITALNTEQTIRTAHIVDAIGVLLVNGKKPQPGMIKLANDFDISLFSTRSTMFNSCAKVHNLLTQGND